MLRLDHLVILVDDLDRATRAYADLGFHVLPGGTHADGLTHNALIVFADSTYLELIAFTDRDDTRDNVWGWRALWAQGGGLIDWCVRADDLAATTQLLRAQDVAIGDASAGGRVRPDGTELRWRSARFRQADRLLPFVIEDVTPRSLRVPEAVPHPNGATGIVTLVLACDDLGAAEARLAPIAGAMQLVQVEGTNARHGTLGNIGIMLQPGAAEQTAGPCGVELQNASLAPDRWQQLLASGRTLS